MFLSLFLFGLSLFTAISTDSTEDNSRYGIVLDAGSTSTKLNVYRWEETSDVDPNLRLLNRKSFKPGLSHTAEEDISDYLRNILDHAKEFVPKQHHLNTPVFLQATAGLRYLGSDDTRRLLNEVVRILSLSTTHPFSFDKKNVQVLSGEEEGVYGWLALNYLTGHLNRTASYRNTFGILEMGGGSTQIAFLPKGPLFQEEYQLYALGQAINMYVQSYLMFGANGLGVQVASKLYLETQQTNLNIPCMLKGDTKNVTLENGTVVTLTGTGQPVECQNILKSLLRPARGLICQPKPCAIRRRYQPRVGNMTFYATQGFTYAPKELGALGPDNVLNITTLRRNAMLHCKKNIAEMEGPRRAKYASLNCLMALYIPLLFTMSYGFDVDTEQIYVTSEIGDQRLDWALGAMLVEISTRKMAPCLPTGNIKGGNASDSLHRRTLNTLVYPLFVVVFVWFARIRSV